MRKLATEHSVPLESISGNGVGGRIRKQDVLEGSRQQRAAEAVVAEAAAAQAAAQPAEGAPAVAPVGVPGTPAAPSQT